jgi:NAD(P) transhydrogenase
VAETNDQVRLLQSLGVEVVLGESQFRTPFDIEVSTGIDFGRRTVGANSVVIGTGVCRTSLQRSLGLLPFLRPESLFEGRHLPSALKIVGGGEMGAGLAAFVSLFGVRTSLLTDLDNDNALLEMAETAGVEIHGPGTETINMDDISAGHCSADRHQPANRFRPASSEFIPPESAVVMDCRRSAGFTSNLNLGAIGVLPDENGQLWCGNNFETWCGGVFGIGSVVGFSTTQRLSAIRQAEQILNRVTHRIPRPHYLRTRIRNAVVA